ncbi:hypothetical protein QVD17_39861 [Tagetes erecta]|uniref:PB1 domain-containing protein n=1 Tax=Tagetes erecta TaxID=13708 RepID=A0AAD8NHI7_TARER|nr:hypothetical protein QVD17_39861 [Tagetes erecta]
MSTKDILKFIDNFPIPFQHKEPELPNQPWVFWTQTQNDSSSAGLVTPKIHDKIKSIFSVTLKGPKYICQFWTPVTIEGRRLLSTSSQPFSVTHLSNESGTYRLYSSKYKYNIYDANKVDNEGNHMIISGGPATALLNRLPYITQLQWFPSDPCDDEMRWNFSIMLPICLPSESYCVGVLEFTVDKRKFKAGLGVFYAKDLIPYNVRLPIFSKKKGTGEEYALNSIQDYEPRYISKLHTDILVNWDYEYTKYCAFTICLRSIDTGDLDFAFEFIWVKHSDHALLLEALLLTLKRCLPSFKFASGARLGDELEIIDVEGYTDNYSLYFMIFEGMKAMENSKKPMLVDHIAPSQGNYKTATIQISREAIEKEFGNTMKEAANNLNVSLSTLKRKFKDLGMLEWPGPKSRRREDMIVVQNEEDYGAIQDLSTINLNKDTLTVKVEYVEDMIKFQLSISQLTFLNVEKEIRMKFNLNLGSYKLKYLDEDGDWITLTSDQELSDCIQSSTKSHRNVLRLCVIPFPRPIPDPIGSTDL